MENVIKYLEEKRKNIENNLRLFGLQMNDERRIKNSNLHDEFADAIKKLGGGKNVDTGVKQCIIPDVRLSLPDIELEDAERLSLETDYACEAVGEDINTADAGAFFLEGYLYAQRILGNEA